MIARSFCFQVLTSGLLTLAIILGGPAAGRAALIIEVASLTAQAGSTGSFDVLLRNDETSGSFRIASDSVQLSLAGAPGVQFTAATIMTAATDPYVFLQSGTTIGSGSPLSFDPFPTTSFTASDSEFGPLGYRLIGPGAVFGLVHVSYSIATTTPAGVRNFAFDLTGTSLSDESGNAVLFTTMAGSFTVNPAAVPEPASALLVCLAGIGVVLGVSRKG